MICLAYGIRRHNLPVVAVTLLVLGSLTGLVGALRSEPGAPKPKAAPKGRKQALPGKTDKLPRVTYDVADLVAESSPKLWVLDARAKPGSAAIDILADLIL